MQDFVQRRIRRNHSKALPGRVLYYDSETLKRVHDKVEHHRMDFGWTCLSCYNDKGQCLSDDWKFWNSSRQLCEYIDGLSKGKGPLFIVGHNIFFDLQVSDFFHYFNQWSYELDFYYDKGLTYILIIRKNKHVIKCLSSTNWYDTSLKGLGDTIGLPKQDVDFENSTRQELIDYCHRDVEIVKVALEHYFKFIIDNDFGMFSMTKASQAYHAYRHRFMDTPIYCHEDDQVRKLERNAYYGGRVECFEIGEIQGGPFVSLDINSMYPYVMVHTPVPVKLVEYHKGYSIEKLAYVLNKFSAVARVLLKTDDPLYALRYNDKIIFPVGEYETFLCSAGLKEAIERDHLLEIKEIALYQHANIFTGYVRHLYRLKKHYTETKQPVMRELTKKMLNSLYGKFAQRRPITIEDVSLEGPDYWREEIYNLVTGEKGMAYKMFGRYVEEYGFEETPQTFTAISAHITETARLLLWTIIEQIGIDHVLYCDTDSVKIRKKDMDRVKWAFSKTKLGALDLEAEFNYLKLIGPKSYLTEKGRTLKGIPKTAKLKKDGKYHYPQFTRQANHMRKQIDRWYVIEHTSKELKTEYDKGRVLPNGKVKPYRF